MRKASNTHKTVGTGKIVQERKNRSNLQQKFREVEDNFLKRQNCRAIGKSHALAEKFQARYNKNVRLKMLAGEGGVESRYGGNRSGKGD